MRTLCLAYQSWHNYEPFSLRLTLASQPASHTPHSPIDCCVDLVAVLFGRERIEEQASVGQGVDQVLVRQHGRPFDLKRRPIVDCIVI